MRNSVPGLGNWDASRAWPEGFLRNIRIEFYLERMPSLTELTRRNKFSLMSFTRFTTAFLKPKTNILITHRHPCRRKGGGGFTVSDYPTAYSRRSTMKMLPAS